MNPPRARIENLLAGAAKRGRGDRGDEESPVEEWRGLKRVVVCRVAISRGRLPSTGDVPPFFVYFFTQLPLGDSSHGRISCLTMKA